MSPNPIFHEAWSTSRCEYIPQKYRLNMFDHNHPCGMSKFFSVSTFVLAFTSILLAFTRIILAFTVLYVPHMLEHPCLVRVDCF